MPWTAWAIDLATGERTEGPVLLARDGRRLDRHAAGRIVRRTARQARIAKQITPYTLRHEFIAAALDAGHAATYRHGHPVPVVLLGRQPA